MKVENTRRENGPKSRRLRKRVHAYCCWNSIYSISKDFSSFSLHLFFLYNISTCRREIRDRCFDTVSRLSKVLNFEKKSERGCRKHFLFQGLLAA